MKKILPFLMVLMVLFAFVACDNGNGGGDTGGDNTGGDNTGGDNTGGGNSGNLPEAVGTDEFAGTTWKWEDSEEGQTNTETYVFGTDRTVKYTYEYTNTTDPAKTFSSTEHYYYSYDSNKKILSLQYKSIDYFGVGEELSSFPTSEEMYEIFIELTGSEDALNEYLTTEGMTWDEFYEENKERFEEIMQRVEYIPYEISGDTLKFYSDYLGDNIDMQTYLDKNYLYYQATNAEGLPGYNISTGEDDDDSKFLTLTLYEEDVPTIETSTTKIEGDTLTWEDGSTSTCSVTWNNAEKRYDFVINYNGVDYPASGSDYSITYTKQ